jgi:hypothetical protein
MKIQIEYLEYKFELTYHENGFFEYAKDLKTNEFLMIESKFSGNGYEIKPEKFMIGGESNVCDARYVKIMSTGLFVPYRIFIPDIKIKHKNRYKIDDYNNESKNLFDHFLSDEKEKKRNNL